MTISYFNYQRMDCTLFGNEIIDFRAMLRNISPKICKSFQSNFLSFVLDSVEPGVQIILYVSRSTTQVSITIIAIRKRRKKVSLQYHT